MLDSEAQAVRAAVLVLVMASMPAESHFEMEPTEERAEVPIVTFHADTWTHRVVTALIRDLGLTEAYFDGYMCLLKHDHSAYSVPAAAASGIVAGHALNDSSNGSYTNFHRRLQLAQGGSSDRLSELNEDSAAGAAVEETSAEAAQRLHNERCGAMVNTFRAVAFKGCADDGTGAVVPSKARDTDSDPGSDAGGSSTGDGFRGSSLRRMHIVIEVLAFFVTNLFYDARGRSCVRNLTRLLELPAAELALLEHMMANMLVRDLSGAGGVDNETPPAGGEEGRGSEEDASAERKKKAVRYMKIGAVSLGAGALLAVTGGLAAPALAAAAVIVFGTAATASVGAVASVAVLGGVFGTAGAGLTGWKMMRRTQGLEEFEFECCGNGSYNNKGVLSSAAAAAVVGVAAAGEHGAGAGAGEVGGDEGAGSAALAVMICINGWMEQPEDYRRCFGIMPLKDSSISLRERLARFYLLHNPTKLCSLEDELEKYEADPAAYVEEILEIYNIDLFGGGEGPAEGAAAEDEAAHASRSSFGFGSSSSAAKKEVPDVARVTALLPPRHPNVGSQRLWAQCGPAMPDYIAYLSACVDRRYAALLHPEGAVDAEADEAASKEKRPKEAAAGAAEGGGSGSSLSAASKKPPKAPRPLHLPPQHPTSTASLCRPPPGATPTATTPKFRSSTATTDTDALIMGYENRYWHWRETELSQSYELYLLRHETALQIELGLCINRLLANLTKSATQQILTVTVFAALMSALFVPISIIKLTDMIDNTWTMAIERADAAGVELAHALAARLQGNRPVTLVGHSTGARVIYSCLKELYKLKAAEMAALAAAAGEKPGHAAASMGVAARARTGSGGAAGGLEDDDVEYSKAQEAAAAAPTSSSTATKAAAEPAASTASSDAKKASSDAKKKETKPASKSSGALGGAMSMFSKMKTSIGKTIGGSSSGGSSSDSSNKAAAPGSAPSDGAAAGAGASTSAEPGNRYQSRYDGLIQDVVLLGAPVNSTSHNWRLLRTMVAGRFINGYSSNDLVLALVYRYERWKITVAGVQPVREPHTALGVVSKTVQGGAGVIASTTTAVAGGIAGAAGAAASVAGIGGSGSGSGGSADAAGDGDGISRSPRASLDSSPNATDGAAAHTSPAPDAAAGSPAPAPASSDGGSSSTNTLGIENVDLSFLVGKHSDYCLHMRTILEYLNLKGSAVSWANVSHKEFGLHTEVTSAGAAAAELSSAGMGGTSGGGSSSSAAGDDAEQESSNSGRAATGISSISSDNSSRASSGISAGSKQLHDVKI